MNTTQLLTSIASARNSIRDTLINKGFSLASDAGFVDIAKCVQNQDLDFVLNGGAPAIISHSGTFMKNPQSAFIINLPDYAENLYSSNLSASNLMYISLPKTNLYGTFFSFNQLSYVTAGNSSIDSFAFLRCANLNSVYFPSCKNIGWEAFQYCSSLSYVNFPLVDTIDTYAFQYCSCLSSITFPECSQIGTLAFDNCSQLTSVNLPKCEFIGSNAFSRCSNLSTANIPKCMCIFNSAFNFCSTISSISLPACSYIQYGAFACCSNLSEITLDYNKSACFLASSTVFSNTKITSSTGCIKVPYNLLDSYKSTWSYFSNIITSIYHIAELQSTHQSSILINTSYHYTYNVVNTSEIPNVTIEFLNGAESYCSYSNLTRTLSEINFDIVCSQKATVDFTVDISDSIFTQTETFKFRSYETFPTTSYTVENVSGARYNFALNSNGYYESTNKGKSLSASVCKLVFNTGGDHLYIDCINYSDKNAYGVLSNLDTTLSTTYYDSDPSVIYKSFENQHSPIIQTVDYGEIPAGQHFIYIKYRRSGVVQSTNLDSLQFKVRFRLE